MGRELARVPENWDHPKDSRGRYRPMFRCDYKQDLKDWCEEKKEWDSKEHKDYDPDYEGFEEYYGSERPEKEQYVPWETEEESFWYQVWENVSEGTPVTPPFKEKKELIDYLVSKGDFWDQRRGAGGWSRDSATRFVEKEGHRVTMSLDSSGVKMSRDM